MKQTRHWAWILALVAVFLPQPAFCAYGDECKCKVQLEVSGLPDGIGPDTERIGFKVHATWTEECGKKMPLTMSWHVVDANGNPQAQGAAARTIDQQFNGKDWPARIPPAGQNPFMDLGDGYTIIVTVTLTPIPCGNPVSKVFRIPVTD